MERRDRGAGGGEPRDAEGESPEARPVSDAAALADVGWPTSDADALAEGARPTSDAAAFADGGLAVADLLARAFRDNPMNRAVLRRRPASRVRANRVGARLLLERAREAGHVLVATSGAGAESRASPTGGTLVGALVGFGPDLPPPPTPGLHHLTLLLRQGLRATWRWGVVQAELAAIRPTDRHWTLAMVGVEPGDWGRGLGAGLVARWVAAVAHDPAPAWVETDRPELVPFYRRFGFEPEARARVHGVEVVGLLRPAPSPGAA